MGQNNEFDIVLVELLIRKGHRRPLENGADYAIHLSKLTIEGAVQCYLPCTVDYLAMCSQVERDDVQMVRDYCGKPGNR